MSPADAKALLDSPQVADTPRSRLVTDAAISVLAKYGSRGLTHRAVDSEAGLPEGSTSNLFRNRADLMSAILQAHVERELAIMDSVGVPAGVRTIDEAAALIANVVDSLASEASIHLITARYEIYLEGLRQEPFQPLIAQVRERFVAMVTQLLRDLDLPADDYVAKGVASFVDGLTASQVFHPGSALSKNELTALVKAFLGSLKSL
jgi:DNA-binding transcriptional regulator YbjK